VKRILIVDDDIAGGRTLQLHLSSQGYDVVLENDVDAGLTKAAVFQPDLIVLDIRMPGRSGLEGLPDFKAALPAVQVIMITAFHDMESTIKAMQLGAEDYIHKPIDIDELDAAVSKLLNRNGIGSDTIESELVAQGPLAMVGRSRVMKEVFKTIGLVAGNSAIVLITGESGTGKELVARAIHRSSRHADGPFIAVNCAAVVESLLESEMFGHVKGAFTGAVTTQHGKFALAENGTIFLDEIGEMSPAMQAKLLRLIQYKEFTPVGGKKTQVSNARIIAATNLDLAELVKKGGFREDLFYRLQVVNIHVPPLRERKEDIVDLVQILLGRVNQELEKNVTQLDREVLQCFEAYDWPGNVRELENQLMRAVSLCQGDTLTVDLVAGQIDGNAVSDTSQEETSRQNDRLQSLEQVESEHVKNVLDTVDWHRGQACEILGISRPRLRRIIANHNLLPPNDAYLDEE
jgi:DNA-binding NtrC family response regulator